MLTVTFYSYKGGVGRTLALLNAAYVLAKGAAKVAILDFDLEAPGVDTVDPFRPNEKPSKGGIVEYITAYSIPKNPNPDELPSLVDYSYTVTLDKVDKAVTVIPAGLKDQNYQRCYSALHWKQLFTQKRGAEFFVKLKEKIVEEFKPDYLLVDARTGLADISGITTHRLADLVVLVFNFNPQNTDGILKAYYSLINSKRKFAINILPVASPVPIKDITNNPGFLKIYDDIRRDVSEKMKYTVGGKLFQLDYNPLLAISDRVFTKDLPEDPLSEQYNDIIKIIKDVFEDDIPYYFSKIKQYIYDDKTEEAVNFSKELLTMRPGDERVYVYYANLLIEKESYNEAISVLEGAEGLDKNSSVLDAIANIYFIKRDIPNYLSYIKKLYASIIRECQYPVSDELESLDDLESFNKLAGSFLEAKLSYLDFDRAAFIEGLKTRDDFTYAQRIALLTVIKNEKLSALQLRQLSEVLRPKTGEVIQDWGILAFIDIVDFTPQSHSAGDLKTSQLLKYYYAEIDKAAKSCNFEFIKSVGDAVLLFGKQPKDFLKFAVMIFVTRCVADNYGFELKFRMVANAGFYHFTIDKRGAKDPVGFETIRVFRLEKFANAWEIVVMHELFVGLQTYLSEFKFEYSMQQFDGPLKGFDFLGKTTAYYTLFPPVKDGAAKLALSDHYKAMRMKLYDESKRIKVFARLFPDIDVEENFLDLSLDKPILNKQTPTGSDYLRMKHYDERRHGILEFDPEDYQVGKTIKSSDILQKFNKGFIFGLPGAGKTTILRYIAHEALKRSLDSNIIFVNCRDLHEDDLPDSDAAVKLQIPDTVTFLTRAFLYPGKRGALLNIDEQGIVRKAAASMFQAWRKKELIIAIDAIDESPSEKVRDTVIVCCRALMKEIKSPERGEKDAVENIVYATSRIAELLIVAHSGEPFFYVNPITMEQMRTMAKRFWGAESLLYKKFDDEIWRNYAAKKLGGTPLTAMLLIFYYETFSEFGMRYNTYDIIMKFILMRIWHNMKVEGFKDQFNMYEFIMKAAKKDFLKSKEYAEVRYRYEALSSLAFDLLYKTEAKEDVSRKFRAEDKSRYFSEETLKQHMMACCKKENLSDENVDEWIKSFKADHLLIPSYEGYIFLHSTVMEFLAGRHYISKYVWGEEDRSFEAPFLDKNESLEALPIAAGDGSKTGAEILYVMSQFYKNNSKSTLPFRCLSETEAVESYEINKLDTEPLREAKRKDIDRLQSKKEWAYRYVAAIIEKNDDKGLEELGKNFASVIPLCRDKIFAYLKNWESKFKTPRQEFLKIILSEDIFNSRADLELKEAAKGITLYLQYEKPLSPFDTNFTYYKNYVSYESDVSYKSEKKIPVENRRKILKGIFGSPNFKHSGAVYALAMSPDGKFLVSASWDKTLKLWNLETCREERTFVGHKEAVTTCIFTNDGSSLISGSDDNTLKQWDINTGEVIRTFTGHQGGVYTCILTQDGKGIISGSSDNTLKQWDINTGEVIRTFTGHQGGVYTCILTQDGKGIISGSYDKTLKQWDINTGEVIRTFTGHQGGVYTCILTQDGKGIISGSSDNTLKQWDMESGKLIDTIRLPWIPRHIAHVPEQPGTIVTANGNGTLTLLDVSGV
ncbi:MAG: AAA family ATPase [Nitrospirae bacterium]|nr:AAA family ATPase [Nitrospirota bacterium]